MELILRKKSRKGYGINFRNLDLNIIFKKRDRDWFNKDRNFCVYAGKDPNGQIQYIGKGRYEENNLEKARMINHRYDMLTNTITTAGVCEVLCYGCTSKEAHIIEAYLINHCGRERSQNGQYIGDGVSLINKQPGGDKYERMIEEYLNLDGNNCWEALRREINGN